eukprot:CAMPEP_0119306846 /NCGR_PEP_ID=MMETSP1333-20130426/7504_1 /TAXON_ID=418940 /ORGANISM="Scyphosphaera apsteinii, Strain RCC1455" /LENGTH=609 /DNA_ID=CAMNT_0007310263 /DNA_START=14 /DNA_END=1843 /DNA_ORIENTATION=+
MKMSIMLAALASTGRALRAARLPRCIPVGAFASHGAVQWRIAATRPWCSVRAAAPDSEAIATVDADGNPLSKTALKKLKKQAEIAARKAAKKADKAAAEESPSATEGTNAAAAAYEAPAAFGFEDCGIIMSSEGYGVSRAGTYSSVKDLGMPGGPTVGSDVLIRGRLAAQRIQANSAFLVIRSGALYTVQAVFFKDKAFPCQSKKMLDDLKNLTTESVIEVQGQVQEASVESCSQFNVEVHISCLRLISAAEPKLPFELSDAARSEEEVVASEETDRPFPRIGQDLRLNHRWVDLRVPANNAIMVVQSVTCSLFREALSSEGFVELHTPKLIAGESESGAGVFRTDYFGQTACLAQSPQLYKQMAIASDMDRVFEIGPVFRAENSNTRRHLCEFTGLDMEMSINYHYMEIVHELHKMFVAIFEGLESRCAPQLEAIRKQYPSGPPRCTKEPCVVHWEEAMEMLREAGEDVSGLDDLSTPQERLLGQLVSETRGTDFYFLDRFPAEVRPFYTMPCPDDPRLSNSYDIFLRGEEICSGAQRVHDASMLSAAIAARGIALEPLQAYIDSMRHGMPPHGGAGIGLERLVFLYLNLDNVRKASMFPRDPNRCSP